MAQKLDAQSPIATSSDVRRILGEPDEPKVLDILALRPTILDLENAAMGLSGDRDIFGPGEPLESVPGDIIAILTSDDDDEPARPR